MGFLPNRGAFNILDLLGVFNPDKPKDEFRFGPQRSEIPASVRRGTIPGFIPDYISPIEQELTSDKDINIDELLAQFAGAGRDKAKGNMISALGQMLTNIATGPMDWSSIAEKVGAMGPGLSGVYDQTMEFEEEKAKKNYLGKLALENSLEEQSTRRETRKLAQKGEQEKVEMKNTLLQVYADQTDELEVMLESPGIQNSLTPEKRKIMEANIKRARTLIEKGQPEGAATLLNSVTTTFGEAAGPEWLAQQKIKGIEALAQAARSSGMPEPLIKEFIERAMLGDTTSAMNDRAAQSKNASVVAQTNQFELDNLIQAQAAWKASGSSEPFAIWYAGKKAEAMSPFSASGRGQLEIKNNVPIFLNGLVDVLKNDYVNPKVVDDLFNSSGGRELWKQFDRLEQVFRESTERDHIHYVKLIQNWKTLFNQSRNQSLTKEQSKKLRETTVAINTLLENMKNKETNDDLPKGMR